jgi:hypothetical protein
MNPPPQQNNVDTLRQEGILPSWITLAAAQETAINALTAAEMQALLDIHEKVGPIDVGLPTARILIF